MTHYALDALGAALMTAGWFVDNPASGRVLAKVGFRPTGKRAMTHSVGRSRDAETERMALRPEDFVRLQNFSIVS